MESWRRGSWRANWCQSSHGRTAKPWIVGEVRLRQAHSVRGKDHRQRRQTAAAGVHLTLLGNYGFDSQVGDVSADGRFEFKGLPKGVVKLSPGVKDTSSWIALKSSSTQTAMMF